MRDKLTAEVDKERAKVEAQIAQKLTEAEAPHRRRPSRKALASVSDIAGEVAGAIVAQADRQGGQPRTRCKKALVQRAAE